LLDMAIVFAIGCPYNQSNKTSNPQSLMNLEYYPTNYIYG